jgi:hypothetical protein
MDVAGFFLHYFASGERCSLNYSAHEKRQGSAREKSTTSDEQGVARRRMQGS